jgi:hypothetical protein
LNKALLNAKGSMGAEFGVVIPVSCAEISIHDSMCSKSGASGFPIADHAISMSQADPATGS